MTNEIKRILEELKEDVEENILIEVRGIYYKPLLDYINNLQEENERLKELCNKYEEEHSTEFNLWKMKIEELNLWKMKLEELLRGKDNESN